MMEEDHCSQLPRGKLAGSLEEWCYTRDSMLDSLSPHYALSNSISQVKLVKRNAVLLNHGLSSPANTATFSWAH